MAALHQIWGFALYRKMACIMSIGDRAAMRQALPEGFRRCDETTPIPPGAGVGNLGLT